MSSDQTVSLEIRFARGEEESLREIHDLYVGRMYAVAYRALSDHGLAADAVQQALLQAWRAATSYDPNRPIEPWLFVITRRAAIDVHRRHRSRVPLVDVDRADLEAVPAGESDSLERAWLVWQIRAAIEKLSESDQAIIKLAYYGNLTHQDISETLDIPIGTVKSRMFRAQRKLMTGLEHLRDEVLEPVHP
ncbi:RNA polymerase sigma factor [Kribbella turkmenica]|nr:RNA polymerase sigma factor [Kribbella turkmenica]